MKTLSGEKLRKESERLETMKEYEYTYEACSFICDIDEAGRRPLIGPVMAGAMILPKDCQILYLNDSKEVPEKKRELLFDEIRGKAVSYGIGVVRPGRIDKVNILQATYKAMWETVSQLRPVSEILLNGAITISGIDLMQMSVVKGDTKSASIAATSILTKMTKDRMVVGCGALYPKYGFMKHKRYGMAVHIQALKEHGPRSIYKRGSIKNFM